MNDRDGEFYEIADEMTRLIQSADPPGSTVLFAKYTCYACGARQTFDRPNTLYTTGRCEECGFITDLTVRGCGFTYIASSDPEVAQAIADGIVEDMNRPKEERHGRPQGRPQG